MSDLLGLSWTRDTSLGVIQIQVLCVSAIALKIVIP